MLITAAPNPARTKEPSSSPGATTGSATERLGCRWLTFEKDPAYLAASAFRFIDELPAPELEALWSRLQPDDLPVLVNRQQLEVILAKSAPAYVAKRKP